MLKRAGRRVPSASWIRRETVGAEVSISGSGAAVEAAAAGAGAEVVAVVEDEGPGVGLPNLCPPPENGFQTLGFAL